ncbi:hypothetical protein FRC08_010870 [Ceratobasidium sp. 394]|nr:hypothetical protein FRC08_010870 [Ceratobasidium sp. 394]
MSASSVHQSTRNYYGSLLPASQHHPELLWLMRQQVTESMKECIISRTRAVIDLECDVFRPLQKLLPGHNALPSPPVTPTKPGFDLDRGDTGPTRLPTLEKFLDDLIGFSKVQVPTLLCTLIYLDRIQPRIPPLSRDASSKTRMPDTRHRVLLATIICAAKYLNDSSPKNKHWAAYTSSLFRCEEVNLMEQQLLCLLNWDLRFTEEDCVRTFSMFFKTPVTHVAYPPTPPYEEASKPQAGSQLDIPSNRRTSRPARIEISSGPAHLHSSYSRSSVAGGAPLSPPPSGSRTSFSGSQPSIYSQDAGVPMRSSDELSSEEGGEEDRLTSGATARYAMYGYSSSGQQRPSQSSKSVYIPPPRYTAQSGTWSRREEAPLKPEIPQENHLNATTSWPALSIRANGFLERVWGGSTQSGRSGVKSSRSVGGIFRTTQPETSASRV